MDSRPRGELVRVCGSMLTGLSTINVELTSRCNKTCWHCPRPQSNIPKADMDLDLVVRIAKQLPDNIVVLFHLDGEPLLYPHLGQALDAFRGKIRGFDTNGKLLVDRADEIIDHMEVLTVSVIENDNPQEKTWQWHQLRQFDKMKGNKKPRIIIRAVGDFDSATYHTFTPYPITKRLIHKPGARCDYARVPLKPEFGICQDFLSHPVIHFDGDVGICPKFDPERKGVIGNITERSLVEIWASEKRKEWLASHIAGNRSEIEFCKDCEYWGIPIG